ncbi:MAG: LysM peptidoglycan-binding domain-containing protein [Firmicutes bacterium]|nr:LysM peptidoglycan-binding domain-containing protein [Bacillota bacterium]
MFIKIPFESEIEFKTNISEITKMSLEHDFNVNDGVVLGNFYISGEYRVHEVSINKEPFNYTLPFTVELRDDLKKDTLEFNIEDFSYNVVNNKVLKVNIEYSLKAELEEVLFERVNEDELESELAFIDTFLEEEIVEDEVEKKEKKVTEDTQDKVEMLVEEDRKETFKEEIDKTEVVEEVEDEEERMTKEEEKTIMDTIKDSDDTFVTYHIHVVKETETIESICAMYNVPNSLINEYNNLDSMSIGDKILIPKMDE